VESAFRDIVSDELQKIKQSPFCDCQESSVSKNDDLLWEYDGLHADNSIEIESEDILIAMERLLYDELREEMIRRGNSRGILLYVNYIIIVIQLFILLGYLSLERTLKISFILYFMLAQQMIS